MLERLSIRRAMHWQDAAVVAAVLVACALAGPEAASWLRYERTAVAAGQVWRLLTGHLVHADAAHLAWNLTGLALVWWLFAGEFTRRGWCLILLASTAAIDLGFLMLEPDLEWYVGFSGVLHGCMAAGLLAWLRRTPDPITWIVTVLYVGKLAWEQFAGPFPLTGRTLTLPVIVEAHSYGAIGGAAAALWLLRREPRGGPSL